MYQIAFSKRSRQSLRKLRGSGRFDEAATAAVIGILVAGKALPDSYENHPLHGEYADCFECHIKSDLLLIYKIDPKTNTLVIINIGSHSALFR